MTIRTFAVSKFLNPLFVLLFSICTHATETHFASILFIADSHGDGQFGKEVDRYLRTISDKTISVASCGSSPSTWINEVTNFKETNCGFWKKESTGQETRVKKHVVPSFSNEIKLAKPNLTVIELGTNILLTPKNIDAEMDSIQKMLDEVRKAKSKCIWIGPPNVSKPNLAANLAYGNKKIEALVKSQCVYIDSTKLTKPVPEKDGMHYGARQAADWGIDTAEQIEQNLAKLSALKSASPITATDKKTAPSSKTNRTQ